MPSQPRKPLKGKDPMRRKGGHHSVVKDDAIREIQLLMARDKWRVGESHWAIAEKYGVTYETVCHWSATASRMNRLARGDDQELKEALLTSLDDAKQLAIAAETLAFDQKKGCFVAKKQPNLKALRDFQQLRADVLGLTTPAASQEGPQGSTQVNLDELRTLLGDLGFEITPKGKKNGEKPKKRGPVKRGRKSGNHDPEPGNDSGPPDEAA